MFCTNCGTENPDGARFCRTCGNKLNGEEDIISKSDAEITNGSNDYADYNVKGECKGGLSKSSIALIVILSAFIVALLVVLGIVVYKNVLSDKKTVTIEETTETDSNSSNDEKPGNSGRLENTIIEEEEGAKPEEEAANNDTDKVTDKENEKESETPKEKEDKLSEPYKVTKAELVKMEPVANDKEQAKYVYSYTVNGKEYTGDFEDYNYSQIGGMDVALKDLGEFYIYDVDKDGNDEIIFHLFYIGNTLSDTAGGLRILKITDKGIDEILSDSGDIDGLRDDWVTGVIISEKDLQIEIGTKDCNREFVGGVTEVYSLTYDKGRFTSMIVSSSMDPLKEAFKAYADYIDQSDFTKNGGVFLFRADKDDIPEVMLRGTCEAEGNVILTYKNGRVSDWYTARLGVGYLPETGYFVNSDGNMGYYYDNIARITDYGFERLGSVSYYEDLGDGTGDIVYSYAWNDEECTEEEAERRFNDAFPYSTADLVQIGYAEPNGFGDYTTFEEAYLDIIGERLR